MDGKEFNKRMRQMGKNVEENSTKLVRKTALAVDTFVVVETPVDTGRARSNWIVEIGSPATEAIDAYVPGEKGSTGAANVQSALDQGRATIAKAQHGDEIHITSNLDYIQRLNEGWSAQAPAGFVEEAVAVGISVVKGAKFTVTKDRE